MKSTSLSKRPKKCIYLKPRPIRTSTTQTSPSKHAQQSLGLTRLPQLALRGNTINPNPGSTFFCPNPHSTRTTVSALPLSFPSAVPHETESSPSRKIGCSFDFPEKLLQPS